MSLEGMRWGWTVRVNTPAQRLVLMAYGNAHRKGAAIAWLGLERLVAETMLDRKTASAARLSLTDHPVHGYLGYLTDTGERRGDTGRVAVYRLNFERNEPKNGTIAPVDNAAQSALKRDDSGAAIVPKTDGNRSENGPTPLISSSEPVTEPVQASRDQGQEHRPSEPGTRTGVSVGALESPIDQLRRQLPHLAHILPPERTP